MDDKTRQAAFALRLNQAALAKYGRQHGAATRLADDCHVTVQTASKWLRGLVMPESWRWGLIAHQLGVDVQWLIGTSDDAPEHVEAMEPAEPSAVSAEAMGHATQAARIVAQMVAKLAPEAGQVLIDELFLHAYARLRAGVPTKVVAGEVAARLIESGNDA